MRKPIFVLILFTITISCQDQLVYSNFQATDDGAWHRDKTMEFSMEAPDTLNSHNLYILLRNDQKYPYSNLFLIAEMTGPDGQSQRDTLEYLMADAEGRWLGSGLGSVFENKLGYRRDVVFPQKGVYTIHISHAMRKNGSVQGIESLPGVLDVGLQVERNEE